MFVLLGVLASHRPGGDNLRAGLDSSGLPEGEGPVAFVVAFCPSIYTLQISVILSQFHIPFRQLGLKGFAFPFGFLSLTGFKRLRLPN